MKKGYEECPFCANENKEEAKKCSFCGKNIVGVDKRHSILFSNKYSILILFLLLFVIFLLVIIIFNTKSAGGNIGKNDEVVTVNVNMEKDLDKLEIECAGLFGQLESYEKRKEYSSTQNGWNFFLDTRVEDTFYSSVYDSCMYSTWLSEGKLNSESFELDLQPVTLSIKNSITHDEIWSITGNNYYELKPILLRKISSLK